MNNWHLKHSTLYSFNFCKHCDGFKKCVWPLINQQIGRFFFRKGSSKSYKLLERLSEPLAELQCCSLQGHSVKQWIKQWLVLRKTGFVWGEKMFGETFLLPITDLGNDVSVPFVLKVPSLKLTVSVPLKNGLGNKFFFGALLGSFSRLFQAWWVGKNLGIRGKGCFYKDTGENMIHPCWFKFSTFQLLAKTYSGQKQIQWYLFHLSISKTSRQPII